MDLTGSLIKNTYGNVLTIGTVAGTPQTGTLQNGAGENITSATLTGGTVTTSNPLLDMTQTWNDGGVTFTSLKLNVTDTASGASSLLLDLQVGASSVFSVDKDGRITIPSSTSVGIYSTGANPAKLFMVQGFNPGSGFLFAGYNVVTSAFNLYMESSGEWTFRARASATWSWTDNANNASAGTKDLVIRRDAAGVLAQRNSTNAQTFNLYNTYTDGSNYERGFLKWNSNVLEIGTEELGTGTARSTKLLSAGQVIIAPASGSNVMFQPNGGGSQIYIIPSSTTIYGNVNTTLGNGSSPVNFRPSSAGGVSLASNFIEAEEMTAPSAPAANKVRIYAEDNGSGKTKLMALFPTGVAQQIAIEP